MAKKEKLPPGYARLKNCADNKTVLMNPKSNTTYTVLKKNKKSKTVILQSQNSNRTFEKDWNLLVYLEY